MELERLNDAMRQYVRRYLSRHASKALVLDEGLMDEIRRLRSGFRAEEGGGGMCHLVSEWLQGIHGMERVGVSYLNPKGDVICAGHYINLLADGTILDGTADQFGDGHDIRIFRPDDPEYGRYRPEFDEDYNPVIDPELPDAWREMWVGTPDYVQQDMNRGVRGFGWWVQDPEPLLEYCRQQKEFADTRGASWSASDSERFQLWMDEIRRERSIAPVMI